MPRRVSNSDQLKEVNVLGKRAIISPEEMFDHAISQSSNSFEGEPTNLSELERSSRGI